MALQAGVSSAKVLVLVGAGLTGSIILRNGRLSELIAQLQELLKGVDEAEVSPYKYDSALLAAQIRQLAQEIKELTLNNPVTIFNANSNSSGSLASYLVPTAAIGAMGYCYMWWKGWSFSDVMFVTRQNMANAVTSVSKQLDNLSESLASARRHLTKRLDSVDWKIEENIETSKRIASNVGDMKSNLSQIGHDVEAIHQMIAGLEGKLDLLETKQVVTNKGLWYLCQFAESFRDGSGAKVHQDVARLTNQDKGSAPKGLQFIVEPKDSNAIEKPVDVAKKTDLNKIADKAGKPIKTRIHRPYPVGFSLAADIA